VINRFSTLSKLTTWPFDSRHLSISPHFPVLLSLFPTLGSSPCGASLILEQGSNLVASQNDRNKFNNNKTSVHLKNLISGCFDYGIILAGRRRKIWSTFVDNNPSDISLRMVYGQPKWPNKTRRCLRSGQIVLSHNIYSHFWVRSLEQAHEMLVGGTKWLTCAMIRRLSEEWGDTPPTHVGLAVVVQSWGYCKPGEIKLLQSGYAEECCSKSACFGEALTSSFVLVEQSHKIRLQTLDWQILVSWNNTWNISGTLPRGGRLCDHSLYSAINNNHFLVINRRAESAFHL
jgi:hypothetical protein